MLTEAITLGRDIDSPGVLALASALRALLPGADAIQAVRSFEANAERLPQAERMEAHSLLWRATNDPTHLEEAHRLLCHLRDHAPAEYRESIIANVPLHRDIMAAWAEHGAGGADDSRD
jgi:hypothetical protein